MKIHQLTTSLKVALTTGSMIAMTGNGVSAAVLKPGNIFSTFTECLNDGIALVVGKRAADNNRWYHASDAMNDSSPYGGSVYEIYGMSVKESTENIFVVLSANLPFAGAPELNAADGNIGWGDLFFNLSGLDFDTAMNQGKLFGVRFAATNNSGVPQLGVYSGVTAKSVSLENAGFATLEQYNEFAGKYASLADLEPNTTYFDKLKSWNVIASGTYLTNITYLTSKDLIAAGYNFNRFRGRYLIGFKFSRAQLAARAKVPESSHILGLATIGLVVASRFWRRRM